MWLIDLFSKIFKKKHIDATSMHSDVTASYSDVNRIESPKSQESIYSDVTAMQPEEGMTLEKQSLQLGLAAGYTGRSIHDIMRTLERIETLMITKDWMTANDKSPQIIQLLGIIKSIIDSHDRKTDIIFEKIQPSLDRAFLLSEQLPEPIKTQIKTEIKAIESHLPVRGKMLEALNIIKELGEISYKDLTVRLGYKDVSSVRSLLTRLRDRTNEIESFDKPDGRWARYIAAK